MHTKSMIVIFLRAILLYVALLAVMRLMGKRQIGEMQPFELVITLLISELACIPMTDVSIPLTYGLVSVLAVFILHQIMSLCERMGNKVKFLISGTPSLVITPNGVNMKELRKNDMGVEDLIEAMRSNGFFSLDDLKYAVFESNGTLSALEKNGNAKNGEIPLLMINDGKVVKNNLKIFALNEKKLFELFKSKFSSFKQVEILTLDKNGRTYLKLKNKPYVIVNCDFKFKGEPQND